jgi:PadR family transcriptional regulator, regulatory protein PadR
MAKQAQQRTGLLQGTLYMLILRTLLYGPAHGHQIGKHIQRTTNDFLQMQHGSLYPALHRLEQRGWVSAKWETAPDRNREFKYYRLTDKGKKQLVVEESQWKQMAEAVARVMWPAAEESCDEMVADQEEPLCSWPASSLRCELLRSIRWWL